MYPSLASAVLQSTDNSSRASGGSNWKRSSSELISNAHATQVAEAPAQPPAAPPKSSWGDKDPSERFGYRKAAPRAAAKPVTTNTSPGYIHQASTGTKAATSSNLPSFYHKKITDS